MPGRAVIGRELAQGLALALWASLHLLHLKRWRLHEPPWPRTFVLGPPSQGYRQPQRGPRLRACLPSGAPTFSQPWGSWLSLLGPSRDCRDQVQGLGRKGGLLQTPDL